MWQLLKDSAEVGMTVFLGCLLAANLGYQVSTNYLKLTTPFDVPAAELAYNHSQFNLGNAEFYGNIEDDVLYSYAGYKYITGISPASLNWEVPPLVKYWYGISIYIVGNAVLVQFLMGLGLLALTAGQTYLLTHRLLPSLLAAVILSLDGLFVSQLTTSLLDLPHALVTMVSIIFMSLYLKQPSVKSKHYLKLVGITLGALATIKLWVSAVILGLTYLIIIKLAQKYSWAQSLKIVGYQLILPAIITYLIVYIPVLVRAEGVNQFIHVHLDTIRLYKDYLPNYPWGEILRIILFGEWRVWWGDQLYLSVTEWTLLWPVSLGLVFVLGHQAYKHKLWPLLTINLFIILYLISNLFHVVFPRYLLTILPLSYVVVASSFYFLKQVVASNTTAHAGGGN